MEPVKKDVTTRKKKKISSVYSTSLLSRKIYLPFQNVGNTLKDFLEKQIKRDIEGKCTIEGFIKPDTTKIVSYSSGLLQGNKVAFDVIFECLVCCPVEGQLIKCVAKNLTQAGIRAEIDDEHSPLVLYLSRDHHYNNTHFSNVKENDEIMIRVIGQRFELYDEQVSVIGELVESKQEKTKKKPKLVIK